MAGKTSFFHHYRSRLKFFLYAADGAPFTTVKQSLFKIFSVCGETICGGQGETIQHFGL